jgi:hypothetical protein
MNVLKDALLYTATIIGVIAVVVAVVLGVAVLGLYIYEAFGLIFTVIYGVAVLFLICLCIAYWEWHY